MTTPLTHPKDNNVPFRPRYTTAIKLDVKKQVEDANQAAVSHDRGAAERSLYSLGAIIRHLFVARRELNRFTEVRDRDLYAAS